MDTDATAVNNASQLLNNTSSVSSITFSSMADLSSSQARLSRAPKTSTESTHQVDIEKRINNWWIKNNDREDISCDPGKDYHLEISRSPGDVFHRYLICICEIRFKLTLLDSGVFKLSSFFRHMKEQHAVKIGDTVRSFRGYNDSIERSQTTEASSHITSKRHRSPSGQSSSSSFAPEHSLSKKNRPSSSSSRRSRRREPFVSSIVYT